MKQRLFTRTRVLSLICALALIGVLFWPIWKIQLSAPQYPEGLELQIYADKLGGDVDVVNGLNHYIGMRTLHEKDFIEFTVLPYFIGAFVLFGLLAAVINRRWFFITWVACYLLFALVAMVDFYRWEYNYGHNLDPTAPIQVPGMSYQPPLIGFKQLLNFGAYSIPAVGGWIFIGVGLLMALMAFWELKKRRVNKLAVTLGLSMLLLNSCSTGPQPIQFGVDACSACKMTLLNPRFGGEVVTKKGRVYKFDDLHCISSFLRSSFPDSASLAGIYLLDHESKKLVKAHDCILVQDSSLHSPMSSNIAAFTDQKTATQYAGAIMTWNEFYK
jgi:copper chaperone NosL